MEYTIPYDSLVRAGINTTSAFVPAPSEVGLATSGGWGVNDAIATCSRGMLYNTGVRCQLKIVKGVKIIADTTLEAVRSQVCAPVAFYVYTVLTLSRELHTM